MIVITGASSGLGFATAKLYKEAGEKVVNVSRRPSAYADVDICLSLREGVEIQEAAKKIIEIDEPIDAVIFCAGVYKKTGLDDVTEDEIKLMMSTNVKPLILLTAKLKSRIEKDASDILIVTSSSSRDGMPEEMAYSAAKWAARGVVKSLQKEFREKPNRVIDFCPAWFSVDPPPETSCMATADIALALKAILDMPKTLQVNEFVVSGKCLQQNSST